VKQAHVPTRELTILLFGASGAAGSAVLDACLAAPVVGEVRALVRQPLGIAHDKLRETVHSDYLDYASVASVFEGVDACFFCLGIAVSQVDGEAAYRKITRDFAIAAATLLEAKSPGAGFQFISGGGTGEKSMFMWARVKAEAERDLRELVGANSFRPAYIDGKKAPGGHGYTKVLKPLLRGLAVFPSLYVRGADIGRAMIQVTLDARRGETLENKQIVAIAKAANADLVG
jgi:uncharacterized protein YbjT (DUF2867 family)